MIKVIFLFGSVIMIMCSCDQKTPSSYKPQKRFEFYQTRFNELKKNNSISKFINLVDSGAIIVFNSNSCNLCLKERVSEFTNKIRTNNAHCLIVVLANDKAHGRDFFKINDLNISDSALIINTSEENIKDELITKEMIAYQFKNDEFSNFLDSRNNLNQNK